MSATLHMVFGPVGAGKTAYTHDLARRTRAVAFVLDDWMARLFAADMPDPIEFEWMMQRVERCEAQIWSSAAAVMAAGASVVFDIGLMRRADRQRIIEVAQACDLPLQAHLVTAPKATRLARVLERNEVRGETFAIAVTPEMFEFMEGVYEPPEPDELVGCIISESQ